jgi:hypothetical protein
MHYQIPNGIAEINASILMLALKDAWVVIPSFFTYLICLVCGGDRWILGDISYHKLNQVVTLIASIVPNVFSLMELISTAPHTCYQSGKYVYPPLT